MPNRGKVVAVYAVVCDEDVWRNINPDHLASHFLTELMNNVGFHMGGTPTGVVMNPLMFSFRIYGRISWDNVYEVCVHAWGEISSFVSHQSFTACFIRAWNLTLWDGSAGQYRSLPFPGTISDVSFFTGGPTGVTLAEVSQTSINLVNSGRLFIWADYTEIRGTVQNYTQNPPMALSDSWIDRITTSNILTSNDPSFVNRPPTLNNISQSLISAARTIRNELGPAASAASDAASAAASSIAERAADAAGSAANSVITRINQSSPFSSNEIHLGVNLLIVFGILGAGTYIIGKVSK